MPLPSRMRDKAGPEKLQGYWVLELGELAGMKKTDVETVKSFLSRVDDKYRASYGLNVESHPRQCIDKSGAVETEDEKTAELVTAGLTEQGFIGEPQPEMNKTTVSLPMKDMTAEGLKNLIFLLRSKQYLIGRAFAEDVFQIPTALVEALGSAEVSDTETFLQAFQSHAEECRGISFQDGMVTFTLPAINDPDMIKAFTHLAAAMVRQAREQKRISPKETIEENEKYYMRIWLLRLGFGGTEGKEIRDLLLKNLKGNSAFRTEENKQRWQEARRNEKEAAKLQAAVETAGQPEAQLAEAAADAVPIEQVSQSFDAEE